MRLRDRADGSIMLAWNYNALYDLNPFTGATRLLKLAPHRQTVTAVYFGNRHGWVEWKQDLSAPTWNVLTNAVSGPDPASGSLYNTSTWVIVPAFEKNVFFRVGTSLDSPLP